MEIKEKGKKSRIEPILIWFVSIVNYNEKLL